ncbi:hypothetical protein [Flavobacterium daemonense]|uniref:hypothetical protein n=1 Tax=Flavobacterium daemonense TaxID=1393049 RepID=UPI00118544C3|nr:hypothetical protein [Flavobacterium daemonense]KAF2330692.1 hypothetical protein FND99_14805 [Flavobacterium daemonense]
MEKGSENIKVYQSSRKDQFLILIVVGVVITSYLVMTQSIIGFVFWSVFFLLCGGLGFLASSNLKITVNAEKELVTIEKTNFRGNIVGIKEYPLNRYYFERRSMDIFRRNRKRDCFSFRDMSYEGGELYYNKEFYTDDYIAEGFPKKTRQLIENEILKIQDKKGLVVTAEFKR